MVLTIVLEGMLAETVESYAAQVSRWDDSIRINVIDKMWDASTTVLFYFGAHDSVSAMHK